MRRLFIAAVALTATACQHAGTKVTVRPEPATVGRAIDQQILSEAIDAAFSALEIPKVRRPDGSPAPAARNAAPVVPGLVSAYVRVSTVVPVTDDLRSYIVTRASLAAAAAGLAVKEVRTVLERQGGSIERVYEEFPDTDARVLVAVSYAGIDQLDATGAFRSTDRSQYAYAGRFKATMSILPRTLDIAPWTATFTGEKKVSMDDVKYWYDRPGVFGKGGWFR